MQAEAIREKRARLIKADAEFEASTKLAAASAQMAENPAALELRRMQMSIPECIEGAHVSIAMTIDLSDYGDVPAVSLPSPAQSYDLTPLLKSSMGKLKTAAGGCPAG